MSLRPGKYRETGASRSSFRSSTSIIAATLVTGLVIDAIQKITSGFIGIVLLLSYCAPENLLPSGTRAYLRATATTADYLVCTIRAVPSRDSTLSII
jgi:hypothetical protein